MRISQKNLFPEIFNYEISTSKYIQTDPDANAKEDIFGLEYCRMAMFAGKYGIPELSAYIDGIPDAFITYSDIGLVNDQSCGLTFFDCDQKLEPVWRNPVRCVKRIRNFYCVTSPDFSLKIGTPLSVQIANCYRNHVLAYFFQSQGLKVIPTVSWSSKESYEFCFDGYSKHGVVIVSTIGVCRDERSLMYFKMGFMEMLERIDPDMVIIYGDVNDDIRSWFPSQLNVCYRQHKRFERARQNGRKRSI